ncbi:MFS transporter [Streptomyces sp. URMC 123]|uniref:MFS transporter n=1 Tax=Streptomyces sp. URMC 123 TaxID=3423403 RepID=UPI003F193700
MVSVVALFVVAANLRPAIAAVSPLLDRIRTDLHMSATEVSLMTTIPILALGICAPLSARVGRRLGLHRGVLLGLAIIALATAARVGGQSSWLQLSCAAVAGAGVAITQPLLPAVVKTRFPGRAGLMTGMYTTGLSLGAEGAAGRGGLPWRSPTAWRITALLATNSALYYCELTWVAPLLNESGGRSEAGAGALLTVMIFIQVAAMLITPVVLGERRDPRVGIACTTVLTAAGFLGLAFWPGTATWLWILALGIGHGGLFTQVLALPVTLSRDPVEAGRFGAMALSLGYIGAALGPLGVGALRDATGDFQLAFAILGTLTAATLIPIGRLRRPPS